MRAGRLQVICVAGARPNYMKVKPVMDALEEHGTEVILVHTGQHYDPAMSDIFFADLVSRVINCINNLVDLEDGRSWPPKGAFNAD